ncbi:hypothetical protein ACRALDRAFT_1064217 [Sodiomyces alcalophilus JCM 7366]|uniref:uncharacterized protein n=1 Tax=Sodiomyces alcalophilus JCM 7366 TaxID=591952 RepID=UPI0039B461D9
MLRRPPTTLTITSEDVAAYEDRRARQARQEAEEAAQRERMARHARRQQEQQRQQTEPRQHRQQQLQQHQLHLDERQQQPHHLSPAEVQARSTLFQRLQAAGSMRGMAGRLPPQGQQQQDDEYTEQDTEMLLGTSSDEEEAHDSMLGGLADGSVRRRTRAVRGQDGRLGADAAGGVNGDDGDGSGRGGAARGQNRILQLTPTPMGDAAGSGRGARTREERIGIGRRGARGT